MHRAAPRRPRLFPLVAVLSLASLAHAADWPVWRHDPQRTGLATGTSNITAPGVYWGSYVGGGANPRYGLWPLDVDGDGKVELLTVAGGRVFARNVDNRLVASSPALGLSGIIGIADMNGDAVKDIAVFSGNRTYVLKGTDLSVEWAERESDLGDWGGMVMGDVTGDGLADLVIREGGCGARANQNAGFVYSFAAGFSAGLNPIWSLPRPECGNTLLSLLNVDTTPALEVLTQYNTGSGYVLQLRDGASNCLLAQSAAQPQDYLGMAPCAVANLDGQPGDEFVCVTDYGLMGTNSHAVFTGKYTPSGSRCAVAGTLTVTQAPLAPNATGSINNGAMNPVADLDEDGVPELIISARATASDPWRALVLRASSPTTQLAVADDAFVVGWARTGPQGRPQLVTSKAGSLSGWHYSASPTPTLTRAWTLADRSATARWDFDTSPRFYLTATLVAFDYTGDGVEDLVTVSPPRPGVPSAVVVYSLTGTSPVEVRRFTLPGDSEVQSVWLLPPVTTTSMQLAVASNLGVLFVFDAQLEPASFGGRDFLTGGFAGTGLRSFTASDGGTSVFVVDSARGLRRIDAPASTNLYPAQPVWRRPNTTSGASIVTSSGAVTLTALGYQEPLTTPPQAVVRQLDLDGGTRWTSAVIPAVPYYDPTPARLTADGVTDYVVQWHGAPVDVNLRFRAYDGVDGGALWTDPYAYWAAAGSTGYACADWNGDGVDDVVAQGIPGTGYFTGTTGAPVVTNAGVSDSYFNPVLYDIEGDGTRELILQSGYSPVKVLSHGFAVTYNTGDDDRPYPNGAVAECPGGVKRFIQGSTLYPGALKVTTVSAPTGFQKLYLAAGQAFASLAEAKAASPYVGYLGDTSVHANLSGAGHPTALVGSDEGYLYALNPCTNPPSLEYAVNLGAAVSEPIFGDTDGDGNDDIIVGTADGFLYGLRQLALPAPAWVWDVDPPAAVSADVDDVDSADHLSARWAPVTGAVSYEVGVARRGLPVGTPLWRNVGNVTQATLTGLPLQDGAFYVLGVRAVTATGERSPDTLSDGVRTWLQCVGVTCQPKDACHLAGTCSRATGSCDAPLAPSGTQCPGGTCDQGVCRLDYGGACTADADCQSGLCVDGVCCDTACAGPCDACSVAAGAAVDGTCGLVAAGHAGSPACAPYVCSGQSAQCPSACTSSAQCASGFVCLAGVCRPALPNGSACGHDADCASGFCVDGVCCDGRCDGACAACAVAAGAAADGTCGPTPAGSVGEPVCAPYLCDGAAQTCPTSCTSDAQCAAGLVCVGGVCTARGYVGFGCGCQGAGGWPAGLLLAVALLARRRVGGAR